MQQPPNILNTLKDAQLAHSAGDFINALRFYEHFFDHALDDDPYALYGIRLSHCLDGWAKLADEFPGAKNRLEQKQQELIQQYHQTNNREKFHDYYCVSNALDKKEQAVDFFATLHRDNPKKSQLLVKYVWDDLINAEMWVLCGELLQRPEQKIDEFFALYDESQKLKSVDTTFDNHQFDQHTIDTLLDGISNVVQILRFNNRANEIEAIERQFHQAIDSRNHASLSKTVHSKASFLFLGH